MKLWNVAREVGRIGLAGLLVSGCGQAPVPETRPVVAYDVPVASSQGKTVIERTDFKNVDSVNRGFTLDLNGDNRPDFVKFFGDTLYFSQGRADGTLEQAIPVLKIASEVAAYRIDRVLQQSRPTLIFFDRAGNGYFQPNLGTNAAGIPYFGDVEQMSSQ